MKRLLAGVVSIGLLAFPAPSMAETLEFEGTLSDPREVVRIPITLAEPLSRVVIWTDSFDGGARFDPITALWRDGVLLGENDDGASSQPGQTWYDSTLGFDTLEAGNYLLTITNFYNFANGSLLADGFRFDNPNESVSPLRNCDGPGNCPGGYWRVHVQDGFIPPAVPEPAHGLLLAAGTLVLAAARRRRTQC